MNGGDSGKIRIGVRARCNVYTGGISSWDFKVNGTIERVSVCLCAEEYCCLDFDQWLFGAAVFAVTRFCSAFWILYFLSLSLLVFHVSQFEEKYVRMLNVQMAFLLVKAGWALCFGFFALKLLRRKDVSASCYLSRLNILLSLNNLHIQLNYIFLQNQCFIFCSFLSFLLWKEGTCPPSL